VARRLTPDSDRQERWAAVVGAYRGVAERASAGADVDETLRAVVKNGCALMGVDRSSLFLRDQSADLFRGCAAEARTGVDAQRRMLCGIPADRLTHEIVATHRPVYVRDAQHDNRPVRSAALRWQLRSVLGVPLIAADDVIGLMFFDNVGRIDAELDEMKDVAATYADLVASVVAQAQRAAEQRRELATLKTHVSALRAVIAVENRFAILSEDGAGPAELAALASEITGKPCVVYSAAFEPIAASPTIKTAPFSARTLADARIATALSEAEPDAPVILGAYPGCDLRQRYVVAAVDVGEIRWGYVTIAESGRPLSVLDKTVARYAARALRVELRVAARAAASQEDANRQLTRDLLSGSGGIPAVVGRRAALQGIAVDAPHVVCLVQHRDGKASPIDADSLVRAFRSRYGDEPRLSTSTEDGAIAWVVAAPADTAPSDAVARVRLALEETLTSSGQGTLAGVVSSIVRGAEGLASAYGEAQQVMRCVVELCDASTVTLSAADLGVGCLLLGMCDRPTAERFVRATIEPLVVDNGRVGDLLATLDVFLRAGRSAREAAKRLDVHENTIRYRLAKIHDMTGLDVAADLDDQLTAQLALLVLRLQGRLPFGGSLAIGAEPELQPTGRPAEPEDRATTMLATD
jgi:sugar diacid utilization regulator